MSAAAQRYVCIHGHFYQPPRENPWLETIEAQDSAAPYHDWNERITAECYAPNTVTRVLDANGAIVALRNNYSRISFNFGPTLLSWMERTHPEVYARIQLADRESAHRFGRGNALAQVYGHCIMPLASRRDQVTQVRWGLADFAHRFGRQPDGMWLPETAADRGTLAVLAEHGVRFTILAPTQAARVRYADGEWQEVRDGSIDCTRPYRCSVGGGRDIVVFFYDAEIARAVAFGGLLNDGLALAARLTAAAAGDAEAPLAHIATDGESYGHHHRFGDMALAAATDAIEQTPDVQLTNYAAYLDRVTVADTVEIHDGSSWSCAHGIERWRADCGCNSGGHAGWRQAWRTPLREVLNWLKDQLDQLFERHGARLLRDPWAARDAYIGVLLQSDAAAREAFAVQHAMNPARQRTPMWKLLELQRQALLSFTSCGWFFDEPSGIETVQVLTYAARAMQLAAEFGERLEPEFLRRLAPMHSNLPIHADGSQLYHSLVRPLVTDSRRVVAGYAMAPLLGAPVPESDNRAYRISASDQHITHSGSSSFATGRAHIAAEMTESSDTFAYAALRLDGHELLSTVVAEAELGERAEGVQALHSTFLTEPLTELVRRMDAGGVTYTLRDLLATDRRRIVAHLAAAAGEACLVQFQHIIAANRRLFEVSAHTALSLPNELRTAATLVIEDRVRRALGRFAAGADDGGDALAAAADAQRWGLRLDLEPFRALLATTLAETLRGLTANLERVVIRAHAVLDLAHGLGVELHAWEAQNLYYALLTAEGAHWSRKAERGLRRLGERLGFAAAARDTRAGRAT